MAEKNSPTTRTNKIRIVTKVLKKALKLWLRSQVSAVSQLEVEIQASDGEILSGCIPQVSIFASHAVYQGLHLTQIQLVAENIQINIGSVLKGQPLRLLSTVPVVGQLLLAESDINASLASDLLSTALNEVLDKLIPENCPNSKGRIWDKIHLDQQKLILCTTLTPETDPAPVEILVGLDLLSQNELQITRCLLKYNTGMSLDVKQNYSLELGSDVDIQELTLNRGLLVCSGKINVNP
ncbi:MAG: DUF2993 domain-containing protein [Nostocaceae cyanobacterium]|nr:DUF2993 domain-containing protein [Nostocaceae cyanobacterium]